MPGKRWTAEEIDRLEILAMQGLTPPELSKRLKRPKTGLLKIAHMMGFKIDRAKAINPMPRGPRPMRKLQFEPSDHDWMRIATEEARSAGLRPSVVVGHGRKRPVVVARWRALQRLIAENPHCSLAGVGRVVGMDHTSLIHMQRRTEAMSNSPLGKCLG